MASVSLPVLLAAYVVGCGGETGTTSHGDGISVGADGGDAGPTGTGFPLGAYDDCDLTTFLGTPGGGGTSGTGGSLTLSQSGSVLSVSYGGDGGVVSASLDFTETSATSATLNPGQQVDGVSLVCAPLESAPSVVALGSGALTYNEGTLFLSVVGTAGPVDAGGGCSNPGGSASLAITCRDSVAAQGGSVDAGSSDGSLGGDFVGSYSCRSSAVSSSPGVEWVGGATGTLTVTETGGVLTAAYADDSAVEGSLAFVTATDSAAFPAAPNETMQVQCFNPANATSLPLVPLPVTSSSLTIDGSSLVLSFAGTRPSSSSCGGADVDVAILCAK